MSIIKTLDYSKVVNFFPCNVVDTNTTKAMSGEVWTEGTAMNAITASGNANCKGVECTGTTQSISTGTLNSVSASDDWICMLLIQYDDGDTDIVTNQVFGLGNSASGQAINFAQDTASVVGASGADTCTYGTSIADATETRILVMFDADNTCKVAYSAFGTDLTASDWEADEINVNTTGNITSINNDMAVTVGSDSLRVYGLQMVKFPSGLPSESVLLAKVNRLFGLWEAGNKATWQDTVSGA